MEHPENAINALRTNELQQAVQAVTANLRNSDPSFWQKLEADTQRLLQGFIEQRDESNANSAWFASTVIHAYRAFCDAFDLMRSGNYYDAWCLLERIEIALDNLERNSQFADSDFKLECLRQRVEAYQSLFPYKLFFSPEMIVRRHECSICHADVTPWSDCGHEPGVVYMGQCCYRIARDVELLSISLVTNPVQKYSVIRSVSDENGNEYDPNNYSQVAFVVSRLTSPFDGWSAHWTQAYHPHALFPGMADDDPCPCGSGITYSNCCRKRPGVIRPHLHVEFDNPPPSDRPNIEFSGYSATGAPHATSSNLSSNGD